MVMGNSNYIKMALMLILSFFIMYGVMFLNVDEVSHIYVSNTRCYMSFLMVSPMAVLMILMMRKMYANKKLNIIILSSSVVVFIVALSFLRNQTFVSDVEYMKAMIPHHSSAILTSKHASIKDPEVRDLADSIIASQEKEISEMKKAILRLSEK